ncbi:MAG: hypothetical protein IPP02_15965 [Chitinophagaceae bacterium]|jgi:hypothetical protein|nr:hypothetical protein [Chitinophagaceae bacterium]MBK9939843.1 hypothetical protein [Chitinophagaceae bacterium]MBP6232247.1 hypothetical protein [Chitinophagaceae bacterium]HQW45249.1 hypothetical protein [Chitinophagaceae bacterium]
MKKANSVTVFSLLMMSLLLTSCEAVAGIFKAGMGFGIFIVIAIIVGIVVIVMKSGKNKSS